MFVTLLALWLLNLVYFGVSMMASGSIGNAGATDFGGATQLEALRFGEWGVSSDNIGKRRRIQVDNLLGYSDSCNGLVDVDGSHQHETLVQMERVVECGQGFNQRVGTADAGVVRELGFATACGDVVVSSLGVSATGPIDVPVYDDGAQERLGLHVRQCGSAMHSPVSSAFMMKKLDSVFLFVACVDLFACFVSCRVWLQV